jgi:hypothetical protein
MMYSTSKPLLKIHMGCNSVINQVKTILVVHGFNVVKSFDLHSIMEDQQTCSCKSDECTCQMAVLLVYPKSGHPATLVFTGNDKNTQIFLEPGSEIFAKPIWMETLTPVFNENLLENNPSCEDRE